MQKMTFKQTNCNYAFDKNSGFDFALSKPMVCPHCDAYEDGQKLQSALLPVGQGHFYGFISYSCTCCCKRYVVAYNIDTASKSAKYVTTFPQGTLSYQSDRLGALSPQFIDIYNQSLRAAQIGDFDLAAIGFRKALECLVKDYAIKELHEEKELVAQKKLHKAISDYLDSSLISTADVVRILGNDYAHYERRYDEHDFEVLKEYMEIFIHLVETKLMIAHPPVSR